MAKVSLLTSRKGILLLLNSLLGLAALVVSVVGLVRQFGDPTVVTASFQNVTSHPPPSIVLCTSQGGSPDTSVLSAVYQVVEQQGTLQTRVIDTPPVYWRNLTIGPSVQYPPGTIVAQSVQTFVVFEANALCFIVNSSLAPTNAPGQDGTIRLVVLMYQALPNLVATFGVEDALVYVHSSIPSTLEKANVKLFLYRDTVTLIALEETRFEPLSGPPTTSYASDTSSTRLQPEFTGVIPPGALGYAVIFSWKSNVVTVLTEKSSIDPLLVIGALLAVLAIVVAIVGSVWDFYDDTVKKDESFFLI
jgi:hypothetical protein